MTLIVAEVAVVFDTSKHAVQGIIRTLPRIEAHLFRVDTLAVSQVHLHIAIARLAQTFS
jgi:hypothetical protein